MRSHALKNDMPISRLLNGFFAVCRDWMEDRLAHADADDWFQMWYPESARLIAA